MRCLKCSVVKRIVTLMARHDQLPARSLMNDNVLGYFCPNPQKGKNRGSIRMNLATTTNFAFWSADTKLSHFNGRLSTESPSRAGFISPFRLCAKPL
jgi:hypothetical protein